MNNYPITEEDIKVLYWFRKNKALTLGMDNKQRKDYLARNGWELYKLENGIKNEKPLVATESKEN